MVKPNWRIAGPLLPILLFSSSLYATLMSTMGFGGMQDTLLTAMGIHCHHQCKRLFKEEQDHGTRLPAAFILPLMAQAVISGGTVLLMVCLIL
ncbi:MAG: hypothetical protein AB1510_06740 [Bacillota bacterium]